MFSPNAFPNSDASHTRQILTPLSERSPSPSEYGGLESGEKKRKRDGHSMEDLLKDSFSVKVLFPFPLLLDS